MEMSHEHTSGDSADDAHHAFARVVRARREELGMSQEELAHRAGLHRTYISDLERGARNIALTNIVRLANALELPVADLFTADVFDTRKPDSDADSATD